MADRGDGTSNTVLDEGGASTSGRPSAAIPVIVRPVVANRYEVLGLIGAGAMGTVYRARDRELDEVVALKVLKKELAGTQGMLDRFRREVKLARRVMQRNVARMFDIGEDGGDRFLTMELVEGEPLARRLARHGRLPLGEIVSIAKDICAGLGGAHEAGVLHRDLKPDNVIIAKDGRAVITDFGVARAVAEGDSKTAVGSFIGTPLYMAPELVEGVVEPDARADLYALGVMMYELITGDAAWERSSVVAVAAARLLSPPPDPRAKVPDLPEDFAELVLRLMARDREARPSSAAEVAQSLGAFDAHVVPPTPSEVMRLGSDGRRRRLTVFPFETSEEDAWLAFGIVEELTNVLGRADGLTLCDAPPLTSVLERDARERGRILDVDAVVTGGAYRETNGVRVTVRLVTVQDGFQLWTQTFERPLGEIGLIADDAATAIADALTAHAALHPREVHATTIEERFLKGRYLLYRGVGAFLDQSVGVLREACELAPEDSRIVGAYAIALARAYRAGHDESAVGGEARRIAHRALDLDATRPEGRVALATIHLADGEGEKASIEAAGALRVAPSSVDALDTMGRLLAEAGAAEEGLRLLDLALSKEDMAIARHVRVRTIALLGEWDRAIEALGELPTDGSGSLAIALLGVRCLAWCVDRAQAKAIVAALLKLRLSPEVLAAIEMLVEDPQSPTSRGVVRGLLGIAIDNITTQAARGRSFSAQLTIEGALYAGDVPSALAALSVADEAKFFDLMWLDRCLTLEPLRGTPEFAEVRAHVAERAQSIVAAYERARISSRVRV